jgi:hypothetical protein
VGQYWLAGIVTFYAWLILWLVGFLEHRSLRLHDSQEGHTDQEDQTNGG